jgi:hypothetical protein
MLDEELRKLVEISKANGFMRGMNFAADIARIAGHTDLAIAIRRQIFDSDEILSATEPKTGAL